MEWLTQNWPSLLIGGALVWMMFGRRGQAGGGCCGGMSMGQDSSKPAESVPPKPAESAPPKAVENRPAPLPAGRQ